MKNISVQITLLILVFSYHSFLDAEEISESINPILNVEKVIDMSNSYLKENGYKLEQIFIDGVYLQSDNIWFIHYRAKSGAIGGYIQVYVEDKENPKIKISGGA